MAGVSSADAVGSDVIATIKAKVYIIVVSREWAERVRCTLHGRREALSSDVRDRVKVEDAERARELEHEAPCSGTTNFRWDSQCP